MNTIFFNEELGNILKSFRKTYKKTATNVAATINKNAPYLSKLESGQVKKISATDFITICNYITASNEGIVFFIENAFNKENIDYTDETLITLMNIDEVLYYFSIPPKFVDYLSKYITENNISIPDILSEINANKDLSYLPDNIYKNMVPNLWHINPENEGCSIKLEIADNMITDLLSGQLSSSNYVFLYAVLYTIYKLNNVPLETAKKEANDILRKYNIYKLRSTKHITEKDFPTLFGDLEPQVEKDLASVIEALKLILFVSQNKGGDKRINTLKNNLQKDLGYTFAFISTDLSTICDLTRDRKKAFLKDLKKLIEDYSSYKETDIDLFLDE